MESKERFPLSNAPDYGGGLSDSPLRYTNNLAGTKDRAGQVGEGFSPARLICLDHAEGFPCYGFVMDIVVGGHDVAA